MLHIEHAEITHMLFLEFRMLKVYTIRFCNLILQFVKLSRRSISPHLILVTLRAQVTFRGSHRWAI